MTKIFLDNSGGRGHSMAMVAFNGGNDDNSKGAGAKRKMQTQQSN
jgi:hypothetical protein